MHHACMHMYMQIYTHVRLYTESCSNAHIYLCIATHTHLHMLKYIRSHYNVNLTRSEPNKPALSYCVIRYCYVSDPQSCLVCIARRISVTEKSSGMLGVEQFTTKQDLQGKILACDTRYGNQINLSILVCDTRYWDQIKGVYSPAVSGTGTR